MSNETTPAAAQEAAAGVSRIVLGVEYKGANYRGFQLQSAGILLLISVIRLLLNCVIRLRQGYGG